MLGSAKKYSCEWNLSFAGMSHLQTIQTIIEGNFIGNLTLMFSFIIYNTIAR